MIQPKYNKQNDNIFLGFDSIEINLVISLFKETHKTESDFEVGQEVTKYFADQELSHPNFKLKVS